MFNLRTKFSAHIAKCTYTVLCDKNFHNRLILSRYIITYWFVRIILSTIFIKLITSIRNQEEMRCIVVNILIHIKLVTRICLSYRFLIYYEAGRYFLQIYISFSRFLHELCTTFLLLLEKNIALITIDNNFSRTVTYWNSLHC